VTGARGLSDISSLLLGSVSHRLAHLAPVTCVTVR
jgi:nucleotide-binding universal stress UspA family protein